MHTIHTYNIKNKWPTGTFLVLYYIYTSIKNHLLFEIQKFKTRKVRGWLGREGVTVRAGGPRRGYGLEGVWAGGGREDRLVMPWKAEVWTYLCTLTT